MYLTCFLNILYFVRITCFKVQQLNTAPPPPTHKHCPLASITHQLPMHPLQHLPAIPDPFRCLTTVSFPVAHCCWGLRQLGPIVADRFGTENMGRVATYQSYQKNVWEG